MTNKKLQNNLCDVAKDIIEIKFTPKMPLRQCYDKFYRIMRKHKIKKCTKSSENSMICDNYEWTMCHVLFLERLNAYMEFWYGFNTKTPKDLIV